MKELTDLEERVKNRQWRRWKRRVRIVAPFAALPLLLCTLLLSIDIVEYSPKLTGQNLAERKAQGQVERIQPIPAARAAIATSAITQTSVLDADRVNIPKLDIAGDDVAATPKTENMLPSELARRNR